MMNAKGLMGVCGTGRIGACLATLMIGNGIDTVVVGRSKGGIDKCREIIDSNFSELELAGKVRCDQIKRALAHLRITDDYSEMQDASFIMEAVPEECESKTATYNVLESIVSHEAIIASYTSSIISDKLFKDAACPERFVIAHPFQPAHLQPLVEIVASKRTSQDVIQRTKRILEVQLKRQTVLLKKEVPGFLVNRLAQAMFRESIYMIENGVADPNDVDKAVKYAVGVRYSNIGLLEYFDDVGFSLEKSIAENVYPSLCNAACVQERVKDGLANGNSGIRAGKGFYEWNPSCIAGYHARKTEPLLDLFNWDLP